MATTITSAGITFNDATTLTSAVIPANAVGTTQIANGSVTAEKLGTTEQTRIAKAWVNFGEASVGTVVIKNSFNISSITKNSTGDFTLNFTSPMSNTDYVVIGSGTDSTLNDYPSIVVVSMTNSTTYDLKTTTQVRVQTRGGTVYPVVPASPWDANITIFGN